jgi:hypothetical protein
MLFMGTKDTHERSRLSSNLLDYLNFTALLPLSVHAVHERMREAGLEEKAKVARRHEQREQRAACKGKYNS